jgi:hypothetical protein
MSATKPTPQDAIDSLRCLVEEIRAEYGQPWLVELEAVADELDRDWPAREPERPSLTLIQGGRGAS